jgi:flagellar hook-associated protein 3 FlgL
MRVTNQMTNNTLVRDLRSQAGALQRSQREAGSGRRVNTLSDDPVDASEIIRLEATARNLDQFRRNGRSAALRLSAEDVVLTTVRELLAEARHIAMGLDDADPADPNRQQAVRQIAALREQVVSLGNTRVGNEYIFGGAKTGGAPFLPDGTYAGDSNVRRAELDDGMIVEVNHAGSRLFSPALDELEALGAALGGSDPVAVGAALGGLAAAGNEILGAQAEVGGRLRQIAETDRHLLARTNELLDRRDGLRDIDPAEALLKVSAAQQALERAYAVTSRILQSSLLDHM